MHMFFLVGFGSSCSFDLGRLEETLDFSLICNINRTEVPIGPPKCDCPLYEGLSEA